MPVRQAIRTPRLLLRRVEDGDLHDLHAVLSDSRAMRYWSRPAHTELGETQEFLGWLRPGERTDDFVLVEDGRVIGKAGAWRVPEVGFILHPDRWGRGLAFEAMAAVIPYLFETHPVRALTADVDPRNTPSIRLLERLGFAEIGRAERTMQWGSEWCDSVYFELSRPT